MNEDEFDAVVVPSDVEEAERDQGYQTLAHGVLSPRHRRFCQLAASGVSNKEIGESLGFSGSRVSILLKNQFIAAEIARLQERIFEETIKDRLKSMADPALNNIHMILTDRTNKVRISEKADMSKWVIEKLDGKATQTHDVGQNTLALLLDKLDAQKSLPQAPAPQIRDVIEMKPNEETPTGPKSEEDELSDWVRDFEREV